MMKPVEMRHMVLFMRRAGVKVFEFEGCKVEFDSTVLVNDAIIAADKARRRARQAAKAGAVAESSDEQLAEEKAEHDSLVYGSAQ